MAGYFEIFCWLVVVIALLYYYSTSTFNFWKIRGVPGPEPIPGFGNFKDILLSRISIGDFLKEMYEKYKGEPMIGIFSRKTPILILNDPELIKDVLIKDFTKIGNRGIPMTEKIEPLTQHLANIDLVRWRPLRTKLTSVFTTGKLRKMFDLMVGCAENLEKYVEKSIVKGEPIECCELTAKYGTDVIGNCAFGIEMNALNDEKSEFRRIGRKILMPTLMAKIRNIILESTPWLYNLLGCVISPIEAHRFLAKLTFDTIAYREKHNIVRHDFIDVLLELKTQPEKLGNIKLTDSLIAAQGFIFFVAGFETSSSIFANTLYELALNHEIQDKLRKEITEELEKNGNCMKYESINKLTYLDKVFQETMRKYSPVMFLTRQTITNYTFEGTKVTIPKGIKVWIPIHAIHRDPDIYPNPDVFDPERFSDDAIAARHPMHFLPFGDGPRKCIGTRLGIYQTKVGLIKIVHKFKVDVCEKTQIPYINKPDAILLAPKAGTYLKITKIEA